MNSILYFALREGALDDALDDAPDMVSNELADELTETSLMQAALSEEYTTDELRTLMTAITSERLSYYMVLDGSGKHAWRLDRRDGLVYTRLTLAEWRDELRQGQGGTQ